LNNDKNKNEIFKTKNDTCKNEIEELNTNKIKLNKREDN